MLDKPFVTGLTPKNRDDMLWFLGLILLYYLMSDFVRHSAGLGIAGLIRDLSGRSPFYRIDMPFVTIVMFAHITAGALLTILAPLQLAGPLRRLSPKLHRWNGRVTIGLGLVAANGAVIYVWAVSSTGGRFMDISSTAYGILMSVAAIQTYRTGVRKRWLPHRRWGIRFCVLVIASWLYRVHYVIWDHLTGGLGTTPDMTGPFDKFQAWAFFMSYLILAELFFLWEAQNKRKRRSFKRAFST